MSEQQNPNGFWDVPKDIAPEHATAEWIREHGTFHPVEPQKYFIPNTSALTDAELARVMAMNTGNTPTLLLPPKREESETSGFLAELAKAIEAVHAERARKEETVSPEMRLAIQEEVEKALNPGTVDPRRFASVTFVLDTGERFRGVVYGIERAEDEK